MGLKCHEEGIDLKNVTRLSSYITSLILIIYTCLPRVLGNDNVNNYQSTAKSLGYINNKLVIYLS